jgi:hypothetical protein
VELIAVESSRLLNLFLARRLVGQLYMPDACRAFAERYRFASFPETLAQMTTEPVEFSHGSFGPSAIDEFKIFGDGVIVGARAPTDVLDEFLQDVTAWSKSELGFDRVETHTVSKMYESHIMFRSERDMLRPLGALGDISKMLAASVKKATNQDVKFDPFGLLLAADHSSIVGLKPIAFRLERKAGIEFSMDYYSSSAPLRTKDHFSLIQKLEALAA